MTSERESLLAARMLRRAHDELARCQQLGSPVEQALREGDRELLVYWERELPGDIAFLTQLLDAATFQLSREGERPLLDEMERSILSVATTDKSAQAAVNRAYAALRGHPCFPRCVNLLRNGLKDWHAHAAIREASETLGMDRRAYCEACLSANQFQWSSTDTTEMFSQLHVEAAWLDAMGAEGV